MSRARGRLQEAEAEVNLPNGLISISISSLSSPTIHYLLLPFRPSPSPSPDMLMVHPPPRHQRQPHHPPIVDRGRSRDISPVALARRASEERRIAQRRALVHALRVQDPPLLSTDHPEPSSSNKHEGPYSSNINSDSPCSLFVLLSASSMYTLFTPVPRLQ